MKFIKNNAAGIILCMFELFSGILLMIKPVGFTSLIIVIAGIALAVLGLGAIIRYFKTDAIKASAGQELAKGLSLLLVGVFCMFKSHWFIATFPVLTVIYGVAILMIGLIKTQQSVDMLRCKNKKWFWPAINAALSIICSIIILKDPFASTAVLWIFTGVSLVIEAVLDVISLAGKKAA